MKMNKLQVLSDFPPDKTRTPIGIGSVVYAMIPNELGSGTRPVTARVSAVAEIPGGAMFVEVKIPPSERAYTAHCAANAIDCTLEGFLQGIGQLSAEVVPHPSTGTLTKLVNNESTPDPSGEATPPPAA